MLYNLNDMNEAIIKWNVIANSGDSKFPDTHVELYEGLCLEESRELTAEIKAGDSANIAKELIDLMFVSAMLKHLEPQNILAVALYNQVAMVAKNSTSNEFVEAFDAVYNSNMSKFVDVTDMDIVKIQDLGESEVTRIEAEGRYSGVQYEIVEYENRDYMILRDEGGKILKPSTYKEPLIQAK